jgi:hypothetical protein
MSVLLWLTHAAYVSLFIPIALVRGSRKPYGSDTILEIVVGDYAKTTA